MDPAQPFLSESIIPTLAILFLGWGAVAMGALSVEDSHVKELVTGAVASVMLGFGFLFFLLWCGAYV
jgi:Oligosaccharyltransferase subunit 5